MSKSDLEHRPEDDRPLVAGENLHSRETGKDKIVPSNKYFCDKRYYSVGNI